jgi:hypothetical protein
VTLLILTFRDMSQIKHLRPGKPGKSNKVTNSEDRDTILVMQLERDTMKLTGQTANSWFRAKIFPVPREKFPVRCATGKAGATHWNCCANWR